MFASNFTIAATHLEYLGRKENLKTFTQSRSIGREGKTMTNYFCSTCGSLIYREPGELAAWFGGGYQS
jgi:hypothetical protein